MKENKLFKEESLSSLEGKKYRFEVCITVVEKMNGSDWDGTRYKDIIQKFADYAEALRYAEQMKQKLFFRGTNEIEQRRFTTK
jgi:hypothetical protein